MQTHELAYMAFPFLAAILCLPFTIHLEFCLLY